MKDLSRKLKTLTRRRDYLRRKIEKLGNKNTSESYDVAEMSALSDAISIMTLYRSARANNQGSGVYKALDTASSVLDEISSLPVSTQDSEIANKITSAILLCEDELDVLDKLRDAEAA